MNRNGFISMYALMLLQILLVFLALIIQTCASYAAIHKAKQEQLLDVAILHRVMLDLQKDAKDERQSQDNEDEQPNDASKRYTFIHEGIVVNIRYQEQRVYASYTLNGIEKQLVMTLDETACCILHYAYL